MATGFHSISFPSEWGGEELRRRLHEAQARKARVSIQLVSPASGEWTTTVNKALKRAIELVSIQLVSPASGELPYFAPKHSKVSSPPLRRITAPPPTSKPKPA